ncbi:unnamed protein product [Cuscuta epithymum]|uniref:Uncharacterized protein n=1 Tax=Cuscuta epithymum TaxID=186058 RepID=A0AAV0EVQ1_9ASTE|nr:unnamed protein product [Cuscuta epithymum]
MEYQKCDFGEHYLCVPDTPEQVNPYADVPDTPDQVTDLYADVPDTPDQVTDPGLHVPDTLDHDFGDLHYQRLEEFRLEASRRGSEAMLKLILPQVKV